MEKTEKTDDEPVVDQAQVASTQSDSETAKQATPHMETIEEAHEEPEPRPSTRSKLPSQAGRPTLTRTPGPTATRAPPAEETGLQTEAEADFVPTEDMDAVVEENRDVLITELKENDVVVGYEDDIIDEDDDERDRKLVPLQSYEEKPSSVDGDEDGWDTDLEIDDDDGIAKDISHQSRYALFCENLGIVPISFFSRNLDNKVIVMKDHGVGPAGAKAIARTLKDIITVEKLDLEGNWTEGTGGKFLAKMLEENEYIINVNMAGNKLGSTGARYMAKMLYHNTNLRVINLNSNDFHENDAVHFAEMLEENKTLRELYLSRNNLSDYSGEMLGPAIGANDTLDILDLSWNRIRLSGAIAVAKGLKENVRLKACNLSWNGLGPTGGVAIADVIQNNSSLLELDITGNRIETNSALKIAKSLLSNESLQILRMGNNPISTTGAVAVVTAVSSNESSGLQLLDLSNIPVEFEFLRTADELQRERPIKILYGPVLRSGNTQADIGKPAVDPFKPRDSVILLKEHLVVNDDGLYQVLQSYDAEGTHTVSPDDFVAALLDLGVSEDREKLVSVVDKLSRTKDGKIYYGDQNMNT